MFFVHPEILNEQHVTYKHSFSDILSDLNNDIQQSHNIFKKLTATGATSVVVDATDVPEPQAEAIGVTERIF